MKIGRFLLTLISVSQLIYVGVEVFPGKRTQNNVSDSYLDMHTGGMDMTESVSLGHRPQWEKKVTRLRRVCRLNGSRPRGWLFHVRQRQRGCTPRSPVTLLREPVERAASLFISCWMRKCHWRQRYRQLWEVNRAGRQICWRDLLGKKIFF